ncbi:nickel pincer cofactor biosynthesis protein LarB [Elusimicrobiota bacterium]
MNSDNIIKIIKEIREKKISDKEALNMLKDLPYQDLDFSKIDHHRALRKGFPEVIFGIGKTPQQIIKITEEIYRRNKKVLITRIEAEKYKKIKDKIPAHKYYKEGRAVAAGKLPSPVNKHIVPVITAGTADIQVAEEAVATLEIMGNRVKKIYDAGVCGVHRIMDRIKELEDSRIIIIAAGMDGVLPSLVGGMVRQPVIAVPTSTGYGSNFDGLAPLLTMLNSCAPGVITVNIDNGFGAGYAASLINQI